MIICSKHLKTKQSFLQFTGFTCFQNLITYTSLTREKLFQKAPSINYWKRAGCSTKCGSIKEAVRFLFCTSPRESLHDLKKFEHKQNSSLPTVMVLFWKTILLSRLCGLCKCDVCSPLMAPGFTVIIVGTLCKGYSAGKQTERSGRET